MLSFLTLRFGASVSYFQGGDDNSNGNNSKNKINNLFQRKVRPNELMYMRVYF